jgi:signal transduction histidine kinase
MRSIRLSLVLYFFTLLAIGLGGVSLLAYRTAAATLSDKEVSARRLTEREFHDRVEELRKEVDDYLRRKAKLVVSKHGRPARTEWVTSVAPLMAITFVPHGYVLRAEQVRLAMSPNSPIALSPRTAWTLKMSSIRSLDAIIRSLQDEDEDDLPREFAQTYLRTGMVWERTSNLPADAFHLARRPFGEPFEEKVDTITVGDTRIRRLTLKVQHQFGTFPTGTFGKGFARPGDKAFKAFSDPYYYFQYGIETRQLEDRIQALAEDRDHRITRLADGVRADLQHLRSRLFLISAATLGSVLVGAMLLIWLGLLPLHRLTGAVSEVSEKDFQLKLDPATLPVELQPIAVRLSQTLDQLRKAFAREKQAAQDISHDLRTPLAALSTTIEVGLKKDRTPAEYREILDECRLSAEQMSHLVERLLALARIDAGANPVRARDVDLSHVAVRAVDVVRPLARAAGLKLSAEVPESLWARADSDKLNEVLTNLLHNAVDYNRPAGSISLSLRHVGDQIEIDIADTGIGMRPEVREHLFERFYRADPSRHTETPHCGLGLAIVKSYVELMNGRIEVESAVDVGTTFKIRLPFVAAEMPEEPLGAIVASSGREVLA